MKWVAWVQKFLAWVKNHGDGGVGGVVLQNLGVGSVGGVGP